MNRLFYPAAVWIDNKPLTDQGRAPVKVERDERFNQNELASGTLRRYVKSVKHKFTLEWQWIPSADIDTIDGNAGRTSIVSMIGDSADAHTLRFFDSGGGWKEYTVFCDGYSETLTKRDPNSGIFFWEISIDFIEV